LFFVGNISAFLKITLPNRWGVISIYFLGVFFNLMLRFEVVVRIKLLQGSCMPNIKRQSLVNRVLPSIAWVVFWTVIKGTCSLLKLKNWVSTGGQHTADADDQAGERIGFCENGAGYGGAIISLVAFIDKIPAPFEPIIYTSIHSEHYARLTGLGKARHIRTLRLVDTGRLARLGIPFISTIDNFFNLLPTAARYYRAFKRDKVDCVYLNNDASCNFAAAIAGHLAGLPLILHARGFNSDTKGNRWVLSKLDHCIPVSHAVKDELLHLGVPAEKCTVVPEGLDLSVFHPRSPTESVRRKLGLDRDAYVITLVGGLVDWKGQDVMLAAAPLIFRSLPHAVILLVGGAYGRDNQFADMILKQAASPALQGRVRLLGERDDVAEILACSDVVVHASTKPEPFGRTFLEGMALGKAVIASNEGGPLDVISHGLDGLLIQPRDPLALAHAVVGVLKDRQLMAKLGYNAAAKAVSYSIESHASQISAVLCDVLKLQLVPENARQVAVDDGNIETTQKEAA
jgi:glycosyltransferase involved in cell wall biosynthesis